MTVAIWELAGQLYHPGDHFGTFAIDIDITNATHSQTPCPKIIQLHDDDLPTYLPTKKVTF